MAPAVADVGVAPGAAHAGQRRIMSDARFAAEFAHHGLPLGAVRFDPSRIGFLINRSMCNLVCDGRREMGIPVIYECRRVKTNALPFAAYLPLTGRLAAEVEGNFRRLIRGVPGSA